MLLIGAGALAEYLAAMALFNGFRVTVCDPRSDLRSCVITLSHDPKLDDLALLAALQSPAFYIGGYRLTPQ